MDILDRLLLHDAWTTRQLLVRAAELPDDALDREFDIGHRTLRRTFQHIIGNMEVWHALMAGEDASLQTGLPRDGRSLASLILRLDRIAEKLLVLGQKIVAERREDDCFLDTLDNPPRAKTFGGTLVHLATHGMHHRAQCLYLMRQLGLTDLIEGDALSWEQQHTRS